MFRTKNTSAMRRFRTAESRSDRTNGRHSPEGMKAWIMDTEVEVGRLDGHQKRIPARVVPFPHFDPGKRRVRGDYATMAGAC